MTFAQKLQKLRKDSGMTQEQLAEKLNVSRQALSKWELGNAIADTENVVQISRLFNVSTDYLLLDEYTEPFTPHTAIKDNIEAVKTRIAWGTLSALIGTVGIVILGIISAIKPATSIDRLPSGAVRFYDGLWGFLRFNDLEWLFILLCILLIAGVYAAFYEKLNVKVKKFNEKLKRIFANDWKPI